MPDLCGGKEMYIVPPGLKSQGDSDPQPTWSSFRKTIQGYPSIYGSSIICNGSFGRYRSNLQVPGLHRNSFVVDEGRSVGVVILGDVILVTFMSRL